MVRSGVEASLGGDGSCGLVERMDPRATGYILYNKFLDKVSREQEQLRGRARGSRREVGRKGGRQKGREERTKEGLGGRVYVGFRNWLGMGEGRKEG